MKKNTLLRLLFALCIAISITSCSHDDSRIPALLERKTATGTPEENSQITATYNKAVDALKKDPDDLQQYINLASVFIAEGRITGNNTYYSNAAMELLNKVDGQTTGNKDLVFQACSIRSAILLNMHQFKDALAEANSGVALNNFNSGIYGALVDANVEMGNYDEAVKDCDKMLSIRPDLRSYSRASYLRQIYGQNKGAIEAMRMAVAAGVPGAESTEWARTNLGDLYLNTGNIDSASILYRASLVYRPGYPYALMGMARLEKVQKNYDAAINYTKAAIQNMSETAFISFLADLYELTGNTAKAKEIRSDVVDLLEKSKKDEPKKAGVKHNVNRELATAYMNAGKLDKALEYASEDLAMRPANIDANELCAWIYYLKGDYARAKIHAEKMLATDTKNASTLYKASAIYERAGEPSKANELMRSAMAVSQYIDPSIVARTKQLASLTK